MKIRTFALGVAAGLAATLATRAVRRYGVMRDRLDTAETLTRVLRDDSKMLEERLYKAEPAMRHIESIRGILGDRRQLAARLAEMEKRWPKWWGEERRSAQPLACVIGLVLGHWLPREDRCPLCSGPLDKVGAPRLEPRCLNHRCYGYIPF